LQDIFVDGQELDCVPDGSQGSWLDGVSYLNSFNDGLVSDCMMMSEGLSISLNPLVQSEHSYSIATGNTSCAEIKHEPDNGNCECITVMIADDKAFGNILLVKILVF
jgi:hypothetical protein